MKSTPSWIPLFLSLALVAPACASAADLRVPVNSMGVREAQTRSFENVSTATAMKAAIDMLQDGGFAIERSDADLGLIVGRQSVVRRPSGRLRALKYAGAVFSYGLIGLVPLNKTDELEVSVNVTGIDDQTVRVRIALQRRMLDKNGRVKKSEALRGGAVYQDLFELLGRSLFVSQAP